MNTLYFGDNLDILRTQVPDATVDLIYLDPPFNSNATYNVLFKTPKGHESDAQIEAFDDTWHWGEQAQREFEELLHQPNTDVAQLMTALRCFYQSPVFRKNDYPRLQILTIGGLLNGSEKPRYPDVSGGTATFKKAQTHINDPKQKSLF